MVNRVVEGEARQTLVFQSLEACPPSRLKWFIRPSTERQRHQRRAFPPFPIFSGGLSAPKLPNNLTNMMVWS
jgi:hypothetical protein